MRTSSRVLALAKIFVTPSAVDLRATARTRRKNVSTSMIIPTIGLWIADIGMARSTALTSAQFHSRWWGCQNIHETGQPVGPVFMSSSHVQYVFDLRRSWRRPRCGPIWRGDRSMAGPGAAVREAPPGDGDELPGVAVRTEGEFQHARGLGVMHLAVRQRAAIEGVAPDPARADGELPDAHLGLRRAVGALRGEALVHFVVRIDHDRGRGRVEIVPHRFHGGVDDGEPVAGRGAETRQVPN